MSEPEIYEAPYGNDLPFQVTDVVGLDGEPINDFSGWLELWFTVKKSADDADPGLLQKKRTGGAISVNGGVAWWSITAAEARALLVPNQTYLFDFKGKDPLGRETTFLLNQRLLLTPVITNSST